ncbi:DNA-directed RNA polymerase I subunit RPA12 [Nematocida sp. LUAm3]|nr:DNA-directed RNA polymerase I subunit RPA12 [Nematocida sp. LUAm3]KAI5176239.1 DNA-directed RNA polymerase I subunit RPA12 [Nematocida sp. LUAm2]KAI5176677.1 DNA-directed RNA polymerase I subunit RPA12 [Nematocida sp. LUAm1]
MFCISCEKYMNILERECSLCRWKCKHDSTRQKSMMKVYRVMEKKEKAKGAKIKEKCPMCKSEYMYYYTMQLRSADEGQTVFYECDCGYKEKLNT